MLFVFAAAVLARDEDPNLADIRTVYLLPMGSGLDQYLADHLTRGGRFQVVTDPRLADAILTDRIGESFQTKMDELYPPPPVPEDEISMKERLNNDDRLPRSKGFGRSRGNLFLVDRRNKAVIWSSFKRPRKTDPAELDRLAEHFTAQLKKRAGSLAPGVRLSPPEPAPAPPSDAPPPPVSPAPANDNPAPSAP
jgi:hypothetical protein